MYVTKEQVEEMIAKALANGGAVVGDSTMERQIRGLAEEIKTLDERAGAAFKDDRKEIADLKARVASLENSKPPISLDMGQPAPIPEGVGTLIEHAPETPPAPAATPEAEAPKA